MVTSGRIARRSAWRSSLLYILLAGGSIEEPRQNLVIVALIGYMRVSSAEQNTDGQRDALRAAGVLDDNQHLYIDHGVSGAKASRPGSDKGLGSLREGDTLVVAKLDRLGRSLGNLVQLFRELAERGVGVRVLDNPVLSNDGNNAQAKLMLGIYGAFAEYERDLLRERTKVGLAAARARGRKGGRPSLLDSPKITRAKELHAAGVLSPKEVADALGRLRGHFVPLLGEVRQSPRLDNVVGDSHRAKRGRLQIYAEEFTRRHAKDYLRHLPYRTSQRIIVSQCYLHELYRRHS